MARRKKKTPPALGDDPLNWLKGNGNDTGKQADTEIPDPDTGSADLPAAGTGPAGSGDQDAKAVIANDTDNQGPAMIILDPVITLVEVNRLRESLLGYIGARQVQVDVSKIEHIDTAGVQLLLAFSKALVKQGGKIIWLGQSAAYSNTAGLLGLTKALGLDA